MEESRGFVATKDIDYFVYNSTVDRWLFTKPRTFAAFGIALPIIAFLGITSNIITCCIYSRKDLKSPPSLLLKAILVVDSCFLLVSVLIICPKTWLFVLYQNDRCEAFFKTLSLIQEIYVICYPLYLVFQVMTSIYSMVLIVEQCLTFFIPDRINRWLHGDGAIKLVITVFNLVIILHLIIFFKFEEKALIIIHGTPPNQTGYRTNHICLSDVFYSPTYRAVEKYMFFICFELTSWFVALVAFCMCIREYRELRKDVARLPIVDPKWLRVVKSGRSLRTALSLTAFFLVIKILPHIIYMQAIGKMKYDMDGTHCYLSPMDTRFMQIPLWHGISFNYANFLNSALKPLICFLSNLDLRNLAAEKLRRCCDGSHTNMQKCCLCLQPRRKDTPEFTEAQMASFQLHSQQRY